MPRKPRIVLPDQPHHVIVRGVDRCRIFNESWDYQYYLSCLFQAVTEHFCSIHAYVLMSNHVHLLVTPAYDQSIGKAMQSVGRKYVHYFNKKNKRTGTLWEGRYKSSLVDSERYLFTCYRYIELNPVRAGIVKNPRDYSWSSFRNNAVGDYNPLIIKHPLYMALADSNLARQQAYRGLFRQELTSAELEEIRFSANREWVLGGDKFKLGVATQLGRQVTPGTQGGDHKSMKFREISG